MKCVLSQAVVTVLLMMPLLQAAPDRKPHGPELPKRVQPLDLRGTKWMGKDHVDNYHVTFEADGTLTYGYNKGSSRGGSWSLIGNQLYWEVNKQYRETKATVNGDTIQGESWNKVGRKWQTLLQRVPAK
jgi:hypothetical protein